MFDRCLVDLASIWTTKIDPKSMLKLMFVVGSAPPTHTHGERRANRIRGPRGGVRGGVLLLLARTPAGLEDRRPADPEIWMFRRSGSGKPEIWRTVDGFVLAVCGLLFVICWW